MLKKYISLILCCALLFCTQNLPFARVFAEEEPDADALYTSILPTDDAYIRKDKPDQNFGAVTTISADIRSGSRRYPLMRFDAGNMKTAVDTSSKIVLSFRVRKELYYSRFLVYPLYGAHRNFDENTLTWSVAASIMEGGVSLADYLENPYPQKAQPTDGSWQYYELDVTDYVRSQTDYIYAFKFWGTPGTENYVHLYSKEAAGFEPCLKFYTEVDYILEKAAKEAVLSIPLNAVTRSFDLPTVWENSSLLKDVCTIEWASSDESVLRIEKSGTAARAVLQSRPDGNDKTVDLTMAVKYRGVKKVQTLTARILRRGLVPLIKDTYVTGGTLSEKNHSKEENIFAGNTGIAELDKSAYLTFEQPESSSGEVKKVLLRVFPDNSKAVQKGSISAVRVTNLTADTDALTGGTAAGLTYTMPRDKSFENEYSADIDVTDIYDPDSENTFVITSDNDEISLYSKEGAYPAQLVLLNEADAALYDAAQRIKSELLSARGEIKEDLNLLQSYGEYALSWESADPALISDEGVVTRPAYEDGDRITTLNLSIESGSQSITEGIFAKVLRKEPDGVNGHRALKDPMHLSDEDFFGKWNEVLGTYEKEPALRYGEYPALSEVEYYAKRGAYAQAKEELLSYWRGRDPKLSYEVTPKDTRSMKTRLATEYVIGNQAPLSTFSVGRELGWYEVKLPTNERVRQSYMIFDRSKDGSTAAFYSKNSDYAPYIKVVCGSETVILPCSADTYMEGAENSENTNGNGALLLAHEAGNPFNSDAKRIFLNFADEDIASVEGKGAVKSVTLMLYGKKICGADNDMQLILYDAPLATYMNEDTAKWSDITPGTFNFNDCIYDWSAPYGSEAEWINSLARQEDDVNMVAYYLATGDENSAAVALENIIGIYTYQNVGFPRALDTGWRTPALLATIYGLINSDFMTPEVFCALVKYAYQMLNWLDTAATPSVANQINAVDTGFTRLTIYFPELHDASFCERSKSRHNQLYNKMFHADGAYREATTGYIHRVIAEMKEVIEMYEKIGYTDTETWRTQAHRVASYYANSFFPNGELVPYGDSGRTKFFDLLWDFGEFFDDDMIRYQSRKEDTPTPQEYLSKLFPQKLVAIMRDGWSKDALYATITAETGHSHGHPDDLHMDIYAYGRPLLIDAGNGGGYNPILPASDVRTQTYPHNTVEINGKAQSYDVGTNGLTMVANKAFDSAIGFAETNVGYRHTRKIFFLHGGFWIVSDILKPEDTEQSSVYRQNWHPDNMANLETDAATGISKTHFAGTANLTIMQADGAAAQLDVKESYIKDDQLVNRVEKYASYKKEASGTVVYNTLLYPIPAGEEKELTFDKIPLPVEEDVASAMVLTTGANTGVYYYSNEDAPARRTFDIYTTDGQSTYVQKSTDGTLNLIAATNVSDISEDGKGTLLKSNAKISDIAVKQTGANMAVTTEAPLSGDVWIAPMAGVSAVTLNGTQMPIEYDGDMIVLRAENAALPVTPDGSAMSYTFTQDFVKRAALTQGTKTGEVVLTIPAGTKVSAPAGWDGTLDFKVSETDRLCVSITANKNLTFDTPIKIEVPFYTSSGAYYLIGTSAGAFGDGRAEISVADTGCTVNAVTGGTFVFTTLKGAMSANGSYGAGGGGGGGGKTDPPVDPVAPVAPDKPDNPDTPSKLSDISNHWAKAEITALCEKGIVAGYPDGTFRPENTLTRAEFIKMLVCAVSAPQTYTGGFSDVFAGEWYAAYVQAAVSGGIASGYPNGTFCPNSPVTREEAAKMLALLIKNDKGGGDLSAFTDSGDISPWAAEFMQKAVANGIFKGTDGALMPKAQLTRAMAAAVIYRLINAQ